MKKVPGLKLATISTGGGWAVGETFARLPPANEQLEQRDASIFTVAAGNEAARHSSDEDEASEDMSVHNVSGETDTFIQQPPPIHTTTFQNSDDDDDNTFVDHGSNGDEPRAETSDKKHPKHETVVSGGPEPVMLAPQQQKRLPKLDFEMKKKNNAGGVADNRHHSISPEQEDMYWKPGEIVSNMILPDSIHGMVMEGKNLWCAIGDIPLACLELAGGDLFTQRCLDSVKRIRSLVLVQPPPPAPGRGFKVKRGGGTPHMPGSSTVSDSLTLWCGHQNGSITIVNTFFFNEEMVIPNAHTDPIVRLYACGGRVWSVGADDTVRVWDAATRRSTRRFTCAIYDLCVVPTTNQVWTTPLDSTFRVWTLHGMQSSLQGQGPSPGNNTYTMRSPIRSIKYHARTNTIWLCLAKEMAILNPKNMKQLATVRLSVISLNFIEDVAVAVGHGGITDRRDDSVVILNINSTSEFKLDTSLVAVGSVVENVNVVGMRFFAHAQMGVLPCSNQNKERCLSVFALTQMVASGNWGMGPSSVFTNNGADAAGMAAPDDTDDCEGTFRIVESPNAANEIGSVGNYSSDDNDDTFRRADDSGSQNGVLNGTLPPRNQSIADSRPSAGSPGAVAPPELLAKMESLEYELREARRDLRALKSAKSVQEDFSTLYARMLSTSFKIGLQQEGGDITDTAVVGLSPEETATVEQGLTSAEGRMMGNVLAALEKLANLGDSNDEESADANANPGVDASVGDMNNNSSNNTRRTSNGSARRMSTGKARANGTSAATDEQYSMVSLHRMLRDVSRISRDERTMQNQQLVSLQSQVRDLQNRLTLFSNAHAALGSIVRIAVEELPDFGISIGHTPHEMAKVAALEHADCLRGNILATSDMGDIESYLEALRGATHEAFKAYRLQQAHIRSMSLHNPVSSLPQQVAEESPREGATSTNFENISETSISLLPNSSRLAKPQSARNQRSPVPTSTIMSPLPGSKMMPITSIAALPHRIRLAFFWEKLSPEIEQLSNDVSSMISKASSVDMVRVEVVRGHRQAETVDRADFFSGILHADIRVAELLFGVCNAESRAVVLHAVLGELAPLLIEQHQREQEIDDDTAPNSGGTAQNASRYERMGSDNSTIENEVDLSAKKLNRIVADLEKSSEKVRNLMNKHFTDHQLATGDGMGLGAIPLQHCRVWLGRLYGKLQWQHVWVRLCAETFAEIEAIIRVPTVSNEQRSLLYTYCTDCITWLENSETELTEFRSALSAAEREGTSSHAAHNIALFSLGSLYTFYFQQSARTSSMIPSLFLTAPLSLGTVDATESFSPDRPSGLTATPTQSGTGSAAGQTPSTTPLDRQASSTYMSQYGTSPSVDLGSTLETIGESIETLRMKCDKLHAAGLEIKESVLELPSSAHDDNSSSSPLMPTTPPVSSRGKGGGYKMTRYLREFCTKLPVNNFA